MTAHDDQLDQYVADLLETFPEPTEGQAAEIRALFLANGLEVAA
ncbi:hypothetical protein [Nesterenkonia marinintestina]|nr:hypothetical protein [Nesterenkonia sp. GX14115]